MIYQANCKPILKTGQSELSDQRKEELKRLAMQMAKDLHDEMSGNQAMHRLSGSNEKKAISQLGKEGQHSLFKVQTSNVVRRAQIVNFLKAQLKMFQQVSTRMAVRQRQYFAARKRIWTENDTLNQMEHQKVYEEELSELMIYFNKIKLEVNNEMEILEKQARYLADSINDKLLVKVITKMAKKMNKQFARKQHIESRIFWMEELDQMKMMDLEYMSDYELDLKSANIQEAKFVSKTPKNDKPPADTI